MPIERTPQSADFYDQDRTYQERRAAIFDIAREVAAKESDIKRAREQIADPESLNGILENITETARLFQLRNLAQFILDRSEFEDYDPCLDLDNPQLIDHELEDLLESEFFAFNEEAALEAICQGEGLGTADFLAIISNQESPDWRAVEFIPWARRTLEEKITLIREKDRSAWVLYPTKLTNIFVRYDYLAGQQRPERTIRLIRQGRRKATPPSSPQ